MSSSAVVNGAHVQALASNTSPRTPHLSSNAGPQLQRPDPLQELGKKYRASLPQKRAGIEEAWRRFARLSDPESDSKPLSVLAHRLAGSGASYGYIDISEYAIRFEEMLDEWLADQAEQRDLDPLREALDELLQTIDRAHAKGPDA